MGGPRGCLSLRVHTHTHTHTCTNTHTLAATPLACLQGLVQQALSLWVDYVALRRVRGARAMYAIIRISNHRLRTVGAVGGGGVEGACSRVAEWLAGCWLGEQVALLARGGGRTAAFSPAGVII